MMTGSIVVFVSRGTSATRQIVSFDHHWGVPCPVYCTMSAPALIAFVMAVLAAVAFGTSVEPR